MDVIATREGKYGTMRVRGDAFSLDAKSDFSERWMVKAGTPEAKSIVAEGRGNTAVTAAQAAAEMVEATGRGHNKAAEAAMRERITELEAQVAALSAMPVKPPEHGETATEETDTATEQAGDETPATQSRRRRS